MVCRQPISRLRILSMPKPNHMGDSQVCTMPRRSSTHPYASLPPYSGSAGSAWPSARWFTWHMESLILDLDGVVRLWDPAIMSSAEAASGLPDGALSGIVLGHHDLLRLAVTGEISDLRWRTEICARLSSRYGKAAETAVRLWSDAVGTVNHAVLDIVREQRKERTVVLLSNATDRLDEDLEKLSLNNEFDWVFNSSVLRSAKPDHWIYLEVATQLGVAPNRCIFVDDSAANVASAEPLGMRTHQYFTPAALKTFLRHV
nr:HAD-IA family hydrolase [Hoyosella altamirensis]